MVVDSRQGFFDALLVMRILKVEYKCFFYCNVTATFLQPRCLKISVKVAFDIASEASYVYILNRKKFIKNAKNGPFWRVFENLKLAVKQCYQTSHFLKGQKLEEKAKIQIQHFE